jgi:hypothetical protein
VVRRRFRVQTGLVLYGNSNLWLLFVFRQIGLSSELPQNPDRFSRSRREIRRHDTYHPARQRLREGTPPRPSRWNWYAVALFDQWAVHDSYKASGDSSCRLRVGISVSLVEAPHAVKEW